VLPTIAPEWALVPANGDTPSPATMHEFENILVTRLVSLFSRACRVTAFTRAFSSYNVITQRYLIHLIKIELKYGKLVFQENVD
jgi:hypothetical protein